MVQKHKAPEPYGVGSVAEGRRQKAAKDRVTGASGDRVIGKNTGTTDEHG